jgi:Transcription termination factor nusG
MNSTVHWNAIHTRANSEKKVSTLLEKKRIVHYCPQNKILINSVGQNRAITTALFPSLIFVQVKDSQSLTSLMQLPNILNPVFWKQEPAVFLAAQIDLLQNFLAAHETVEVTKIDLHIDSNNYLKESSNLPSNLSTRVYTLELPSIGYFLSAKTKLTTNFKLVTKKGGGKRTTDSLSSILGLRIISSKFK